jgi:hypothetical protein
MKCSVIDEAGWWSSSLDSILVSSDKLEPDHSDIIQLAAYPCTVAPIQPENEANEENEVEWREMQKSLSSPHPRFLLTMSDDFRSFRMDIFLIFFDDDTIYFP